MMASLKQAKKYREFIQLSEYSRADEQIARILFLDADYVRKNANYLMAFHPKAEFVYGRGVVTLSGDYMSRCPTLVSSSSGALGDIGIRTVNMDVQEETSRIVIVVEDEGDNVEKAVRAIHATRGRLAAEASRATTSSGRASERSPTK